MNKLIIHESSVARNKGAFRQMEWSVKMSIERKQHLWSGKLLATEFSSTWAASFIR